MALDLSLTPEEHAEAVYGTFTRDGFIGITQASILLAEAYQLSLRSLACRTDKLSDLSVEQLRDNALTAKDAKLKLHNMFALVQKRSVRLDGSALGTRPDAAGTLVADPWGLYNVLQGYVQMAEAVYGIARKHWSDRIASEAGL
jgi:hypothetical protein